MGWTDKGDMLLGIGEPARSVDINAIYDNFEGMAIGDTGAPEITEAAFDANVTAKLNAGANGALLEPPTAGTTYTQKQMGNISQKTGSSTVYVTSFSGGGFVNIYSSGTCINSGTITVRTDADAFITDGSVNIRTELNGVVVDTLQLTVTGLNQINTRDVSVNRGDTIFISMLVSGSNTNTGKINECSIHSGNNVIAVV